MPNLESWRAPEAPPASPWRAGLLLLSCASACWCPLRAVPLYQEVAAAASLALVCVSFPLVSWGTFSSGCLGTQPFLLKGEEGPSLVKPDHRYPPPPLFAGGSLRVA